MSYVDGMVLGPDMLYLATQLDKLDPRETAHTRMSVYAPGKQATDFAYHDLPDNVVSAFSFKFLPEDKHRFVALARLGQR